MTPNKALITAGIAAAFIVTAPSEEALAYIGPGAGLTMLGSLWAVILAVGIALAGVFMLPVRMILRKRRRKAADSSKQETQGNVIGDE